MLVHIDENEQTVEEIVFHVPSDVLNESTDDHGESDSDIRTVSSALLLSPQPAQVCSPVLTTSTESDHNHELNASFLSFLEHN